jgi:hypothetical protein
MTDKEAIDYFLLELVANIKEEYNKDINTTSTQDTYIIGRLAQIAHQVCQATKKSIIQSMPIKG